MTKEDLALLAKELEEVEYQEQEALFANKLKLHQRKKKKADILFLKLLKQGNQYIKDNGDSKEANQTVIALL